MSPTTFPERAASPSGPRPQIREASFADYEKIAALQLRNGLTTRSRDDWEALWTGNPAWTKASKPLPIGWVLESPGGEIAGYIGNLPLSYQFRGRELQAATAYSWAVDAPYRRYSIQLLHRFIGQKEVDFFVFATVNAASEAVYRALQFSKAPAGTWDKSAFWITGHREFVLAARREQSVLIPEWLARPFSAALSLRDMFTRAWHSSKTNVVFEIKSGFDERFDPFWEQLRVENQDRLLAARDWVSLDWHFRRSLQRGEAWVLTASDRERLVAYAVFDRWDLARLDLKRLRFVDFQCLAGYEKLLRPAISSMLRLCRREKIHVAENIGCWLDARGIPGAAPYRRKMKSWIFYYKARDPELSAALRDPGAWSPTSFDGDASL